MFWTKQPVPFECCRKVKGIIVKFLFIALVKLTFYFFLTLKQGPQCTWLPGKTGDFSLPTSSPTTLLHMKQSKSFTHPLWDTVTYLQVILIVQSGMISCYISLILRKLSCHMKGRNVYISYPVSYSFYV